MTKSTTDASATHALDHLHLRLGSPTSIPAEEGPKFFTWEGLGGDTVVFARSAAGWEGVDRQVEAGLERHTAAAVVVACGSGARPLNERADLLALIRICDAPGVRRVAVTDLDRIARDSSVLLEVAAEISSSETALESLSWASMPVAKMLAHIRAQERFERNALAASQHLDRSNRGQRGAR